MAANTARTKIPQVPRHKPKQKAVEEPIKPSNSYARERVAVVIIAIASFLGLAIISFLTNNPFPITDEKLSFNQNLMGPVGNFIAKLLLQNLGWCALIMVVYSFLIARSVWKGWSEEEGYSFFASSVGFFFMTLSSTVIISAQFGVQHGGKLGETLGGFFIENFNTAGTTLFSFAVFILSVGSATGIGTAKIFSLAKYLTAQLELVFKDTGYLFVTLTKSLARGFANTWRFSSSKMNELLSGSTEKIKEFNNDFFEARVSSKKPLDLSFETDLRRSGNGADIQARKKNQVRDSLPEFTTKKQVSPKNQELELKKNKSTGKKLSELIKKHLERQRQRVFSKDGNLDNEKSNVEQFQSFNKTLSASPVNDSQKISISRNKVLSTGPEVGFASTRTLLKNGKSSDSFQLPPLNLLVTSNVKEINIPQDKELYKNSQRLEQTLADFKIAGKIIEVHPGPVITLYQFEPAPGVKVQKIITLADDLALALKVASVRVYAPVPGQGTVGIEVPNAEREIVRLRDILASEEAAKNTSSLTIAFGKDTFGMPFVTDLAKMPHLLIAGATGTGKSVCINSILMSLLFRNTPKDLRLLMIDPKMLELSIYEDIPHLKAPVVTNPKKAKGILWWAVEEMERRYYLMKKFGVRDISSFNLKYEKGLAQEGSLDKANSSTSNGRVVELTEKNIVTTLNEEVQIIPGTSSFIKADNSHSNSELANSPPAYLPRIVVVIDEMADLMLTVGKEIEDLLARLAQKARAAGIHLILATQRPSVDVITGLIKANFPSRISFKVASRIDSRTVLDCSGSERLLGQGDMLFLSPGGGRLRRLHGAFVSDEEVHDTVMWIKNQQGPDYDPEIEKVMNKVIESEAIQGSLNLEDTEVDALYDQAVSMVLEKGHASTSMVQRVFRIGYNRAARILEMMEREGIVGAGDGAKPRQILVPHKGENSL